MNNIQFCKSFYFFECRFKKYHHTDNSGGTNCHHIGYIKSGSAQFKVGGKVYEFKEGDVFYTPPGCKYNSYWQGEDIIYDSYAFTFFPNDSDYEYDIQKFRLTEKAMAVLEKLTLNKRISCLSVGLLYEFLNEVIPHMIPLKKDENGEMIAKARNYMRENICCSVPELSRHLGMSESAVYMLFRTRLSSTPIAEKNKIRTEIAKELLSTTDMSVEEISERLGFSSAAYFRKVLRSFCGKIPREMRKDKKL